MSKVGRLLVGVYIVGLWKKDGPLKKAIIIL